MTSNRYSRKRLAEELGVWPGTLKNALESGSSWETVSLAIRLAQRMGTTVEYLFNPETEWPMPEKTRLATPEEVSRMAVESLERLGATEELAKLAAGIRPESTPEATSKGRSKPRRRK